MESEPLWTTTRDDPNQLTTEGDPLMRAVFEGLEAAPKKLTHLLSLPKPEMLDQLRTIVCLTLQAEATLIHEKGVREDLANEQATADVLIPAVSDPPESPDPESPSSSPPEPSPDQLQALRAFRRWMLDQPPTFPLTTIGSDPET